MKRIAEAVNADIPVDFYDSVELTRKLRSYSCNLMHLKYLLNIQFLIPGQLTSQTDIWI